MEDLLLRFGLSFDRPGLYELASIFLPLYSGEFKTSIEIEIGKDNEHRGYTVFLFMVPHAEGIVERAIVVTADIDNNFQFKEMLIAMNVGDHIIPDIKELYF